MCTSFTCARTYARGSIPAASLLWCTVPLRTRAQAQKRRGDTSHDSSLVTIQTERKKGAKIKALSDLRLSCEALARLRLFRICKDRLLGLRPAGGGALSPGRRPDRTRGLLRRRWCWLGGTQSWRMERDEVSFWRSVVPSSSLFLSRLRLCVPPGDEKPH